MTPDTEQLTRPHWTHHYPISTCLECRWRVSRWTPRRSGQWLGEIEALVETGPRQRRDARWMIPPKRGDADYRVCLDGDGFQGTNSSCLHWSSSGSDNRYSSCAVDNIRQHMLISVNINMPSWLVTDGWYLCLLFVWGADTVAAAAAAKQ